MEQDGSQGGLEREGVGGQGGSGSGGDLNSSGSLGSGGGLDDAAGTGAGDLGGSAGGLGGSTGGSTGGLGGSTGGTGGYGGSTGGLGASTGGGSAGGGTDDDFASADQSYYQRHYATTTPTPPATSYDEARTGYELGHRAASNPTYTGREFTEVEVDIRRDYGEDREGRFERVRGYAAHAFDWKTILGGIALVAGGWWAGRKLYDSLRDLGHEEEQDCRTYYESHTARASVPYDRARTVYVVGYAAARNPEYAGRSFDDVEPHLRSGFTGSRAESYDSLRDFARRGYERGGARGSSGGTGGAGTTGGTGTGGSTGGLGTGGTGGFAAPGGGTGN